MNVSLKTDMAYTPRATECLSALLMQSRKKEVTHHPSHPCYQLCDWYNWSRVTTTLLDPVATSSPGCQSFASKGHPHTEYVFFHCWDCVWATSITKIHLLSSIRSILIHYWQTGRKPKDKDNFFVSICDASKFWSDTEWQSVSGVIHHVFTSVLHFCPLFQTAKDVYFFQSVWEVAIIHCVIDRSGIWWDEKDEDGKREWLACCLHLNCVCMFLCVFHKC